MSSRQLDPNIMWNDSLDLSSHGQAEESEEVDEQNGPVDRDIGSTGDGAEESDTVGFRGRVPELEFCPSVST